MTKFNYLSDICGSDKAFCARIKLIGNVDVDKGDLLYFDEESLGVTPKKGSLTSKAGVCAESYKKAASDLVPSDGSGMVNVIVSGDALYRVDPVKITDSGKETDGGICTGIAAEALGNVTGIVNSKLVLLYKAPNSQNTASVGSVHTIVSGAVIDGFVTFETDTAIKGSEGDVYAFVPNYGFELLDLDANGNLVLQFDNKGSFTVMEASEKAYTLRINGIR